MPGQLVDDCAKAGDGSLAEPYILQSDQLVLPIMQNGGHVDFADSGELQLTCQFRVNDGAGGACIHQEAERTGTVYPGFDNHQVAVVQLEPYCLFSLLSLRDKRCGKSNYQH